MARTVRRSSRMVTNRWKPVLAAGLVAGDVGQDPHGMGLGGLAARPVAALVVAMRQVVVVDVEEVVRHGLPQCVRGPPDRISEAHRPALPIGAR